MKIENKNSDTIELRKVQAFNLFLFENISENIKYTYAYHLRQHNTVYVYYREIIFISKFIIFISNVRLVSIQFKDPR